MILLVVIVLAATVLTAPPVFACFSGYYAPTFLDLSNPVIGAGAITMFAALLLSVLGRNYARGTGFILLFLGVSYYGHWAYSGDCGAQIVYLNRVALGIATLWFGFEAYQYFRRGAATDV